MSMMSSKTIFALSTGVGKAAIAVIRISGPQARQAVTGLAGSVPAARKAEFRTLRDPRDRRVLDRGIVLFFPAPDSQTGEDVAELHIHGGRAVASSVLDGLGSVEGLRPAEAGEFSRRALLNGKMDLLDLEALADLIDADTEAQRRQAVEGAGSLLRKRSEVWRHTLLGILAELEAEIDFSDEDDVASQIDSGVQQGIGFLIGELESALKHADRGERIREGFKVALLGPPNAGKSSLLNAFAGRDVAIVSEIPGTTRDRVEVSLNLSGLAVLVTDTAGLQETGDRIEREGIRRSLEAAREADLVLWLCAANAEEHSGQFEDPAVSVKTRRIFTKSDLGEPQQTGYWTAISTKEDQGVDVLLSMIEEVAREELEVSTPALVTRARQKAAIVECLGALKRARGLGPTEFELRAEDVRLAIRALERLVGRIEVDDVLSAIFSRFCIGK
jgi:tRNA modification GTPase